MDERTQAEATRIAAGRAKKVEAEVEAEVGRRARAQGRRAAAVAEVAGRRARAESAQRRAEAEAAARDAAAAHRAAQAHAVATTLARGGEVIIMRPIYFIRDSPYKNRGGGIREINFTAHGCHAQIAEEASTRVEVEGKTAADDDDEQLSDSSGDECRPLLARPLLDPTMFRA